MTRIRVVTVAGHPEIEATLAERIGAHPELELLMRCVDRAEVLGAIRGGNLDAVVSVGLPRWLDPQVVEEARARRVPIVVVGQEAVAPHEVTRLGLRYVSTPEPLAILDALGTAGGPPPPPLPARASPAGRLIAVWGPKGAPGRTSIALELASLVARSARSTVLVDGDPYGGDLLQLTGVVEELPTIVWACRMAAKDELDGPLLGRELRRVGSNGPVLLPGLPRAELWPEISEFGWRRLLAEARSAFEYTVCDTGFCFEPDPSPYPEAGEGRNRLARIALTEADRVVAVCRADPVGVKQFAWAMDGLRALVDPERVLVVLNRTRPGDVAELRRLVHAHTGKRPAACVPERAGDWRRAVEAGLALSEMKPSSEVPDELRSVVELLGLAVPARGLLGRLAGRR